MSFNESPSLSDYEQGLPQKQRNTGGRKLKTWILIFGLAVICLSLWIWAIEDSGSVNILMGNGTIRGYVVDREGSPLNGEAFVMGMDKEVVLDGEGYFEIEGIPAGLRSLVVAHNGAAEEYPVTIKTGEIADMGEIRFIVVTPSPELQ